MNKNDRNMSSMVAHALRMMFGTFASRILGLVREMLTAAFFGATRQLDAFYIAYTLANLSRQLLAEGALSASFVPVFSRTLEKNGKDQARDLAQQSLFVLLCGGIFVVILGVIFAPLFVGIMAPGFDFSDRILAVSLTRAMFPFLIFISVAALAMGILNSNGSFFIPAIAPALSNFVYITYIILTSKRLSVWNLVVAVLLGGLSQMLLQWYYCKKIEIPLYPKLPQKGNEDLRSMMGLFLPYAAGLSLNQVNPIISRMLGSFLQGGSISVLNYADRVLQLPLGLFVIALSQAVLPMLSKQSNDDTASFRDFIRDALRLNLFVVFPVAIWLSVLSTEVIHLLFYRGAFNMWAWHATSTALSLYSLGLPGMATGTLLLRAMYARRMPKSAVSVTVVTVTVNLFASLLLMHYFKYAGLATATAVAFTSASIFGAYSLSKNLNEKLCVFERMWVTKLLVSVSIMLLSVLVCKYVYPYPDQSSLTSRVLWIILLMFIGAFSYATSTLLLKCGEWQWVRNALK
ncbi:MAG: murein biosynthesis integral membrane protein MurJ [Synergistaceae bacterium]